MVVEDAALDVAEADKKQKYNEMRELLFCLMSEQKYQALESMLRRLLVLLAEGVEVTECGVSVYHVLPSLQSRVMSAKHGNRLVNLWLACMLVLGRAPKGLLVINDLHS
jgi:hypothetical protein